MVLLLLVEVLGLYLQRLAGRGVDGRDGRGPVDGCDVDIGECVEGSWRGRVDCCCHRPGASEIGTIGYRLDLEGQPWSLWRVLVSRHCWMRRGGRRSGSETPPRNQGFGGFITGLGVAVKGRSGNAATGLTGCDRFETLRVKH